MSAPEPADPMTVEKARRVAEDPEITKKLGWGVDALEAARVLAAEVNRLSTYAEALWHRPNVDALTTRELLEELRARGEAAAAAGGPYYVTADNMAFRMSIVLAALPDALLDYRAVGS